MQGIRNPDESPLFRYETFINFLTLVFRHEERDTIFTMLSVLSDPTNALRIPLPPRSQSVEICRTPWSDFNFVEADKPSVSYIVHSQPPAGLALPRVESQLTSFSKSPNSQLIASGHDVIHTPVTFPILRFYYGICDWHIFCARA